MPKKSTPPGLSDFRPVAFTLHVMKALERLVLDCLQFGSQTPLGVDDAVTYLLQRSHSHLDGGGGFYHQSASFTG